MDKLLYLSMKTENEKKEVDKETKKDTEKDQNSKSKKEEVQESPLKNLVIKQGDYQIHVLVEKIIQLNSINDE